MTTSPVPRRSAEDGTRRIRAFVAAAVLGAVILGIAAAILAIRAYGNAKDDQVARVETAAAVAAGDYRQFLNGRVQVLEALASSDSVVQGDTAGVQRRLDRMDPDAFSLSEGVTWFGPAGVARATSGAKIEIGARAEGELKRLLQAARAGGTPQVSGSIQQSVYGEPLVALVVPTRDEDGSVNGALVGGIGTAWLNARALERRAVRGGDTLVLDRSGTLFVGPGVTTPIVLGRDPMFRSIRTAPTRPVDEAVVGSLVGVTDPLGRADRVLGFATEARTSGWTVMVDTSAAAVFADARDTLRVELAILALLVALGIAGALLLGRRLARQYAETHAAEERIRRLQAMTAGASAASTPEEVAQAVLELGQSATGAVAGAIALIDDEGTGLRTIALVGYPDRVGESFATYPLDADLPTPQSIREGPVWLAGAPEVLARYPHLEGFQRELTHEAFAALPLMVEGRPIGGLALGFPGRHRFDAEEQAFLRSVADLTAQALDRARLYEREQRKTERQQLLAEAGVMLDAPLGARATLTALAELSVPRLADWCSVSVPTEEGVDVVAVAHADPARLALAEAFARRFPARPEDDSGVGSVLRTGRSEFRPVLTPATLEEQVPEPERRSALEGLGLISAMIVPLVARGRTLGAMVLASSESGRHFTADDLAFAEDLGARAGLAIDNAILLDRSRDIARTLQASLLPARLPEVDGLDVAARYVAGGEGVEVGGDFYDLFPLADDRGWAAVLGDVCGKGTEAAALTALARHTLRAESDDLAPAEVLGRLNRAVLRESADSRFLTATYAWLRQENGGVSGQLARGGHPPSLLARADGSVETLCPRGPLLGILDDTRFAESGFTLHAGDALVLFSDGVLEARSATGEFFGLERVISLVSGLAGRDAETIARDLDRALERFQGPAGRDDRAILIVRVAQRPSDEDV